MNFTKEQLLEIADWVDEYPPGVDPGKWGHNLHPSLNHVMDILEEAKKSTETFDKCCPAMKYAAKHNLDPRRVLPDLELQIEDYLESKSFFCFTEELRTSPKWLAGIVRKMAKNVD